MRVRARKMNENFQPANELELALVRATSDAAARPEFYRKLLSSQLFFVTPDAPEEETTVAPAGEQVVLVFWGDANESFLPFFSSRERLMQVIGQAPEGAGAEACGFIAVLGRDAFVMLAQASTAAVLNPGLPCGKRFVSEEIRAIADGSIFGGELITIDKHSSVLLGQPAEYPTELVDALRALFAKHRAVEAAFLAQIHDPKSDLPPHPIIGVVGPGCDDAVQEAGMLASAIVQGPVDFAEMTADDQHDLATYFRAEATPFYERGGGGR